MKKLIPIIAGLGLMLSSMASFAQTESENAFPKLKQMQEELKLSEQQLTSFKNLMKERKIQLESIRMKEESTSLKSKEQLKQEKLNERIKEREVNQNFRTQIRELLNPDQVEKFNEMLSESRTKMIRHKHEHGKDGTHIHKKGRGHEKDHKHENQIEHKVIKDSHN